MFFMESGIFYEMFRQALIGGKKSLKYEGHGLLSNFHSFHLIILASATETRHFPVLRYLDFAAFNFIKDASDHQNIRITSSAEAHTSWWQTKLQGPFAYILAIRVAVDMRPDYAPFQQLQTEPTQVLASSLFILTEYLHLVTKLAPMPFDPDKSSFFSVDLMHLSKNV